MAKLKTDPVSASDITAYLESSSDFAFELRCRKELIRIGYDVEHGGSYADPITGKPRQFDIRARRIACGRHVLCAVECKNLKLWFPLLMMCTPRNADESFHELVVCEPHQRSEAIGKFVKGDDPILSSHNYRATPTETVYSLNDPVGKSLAQVGLTASDGSITANDAEVYEKWSQAVASADALAEEAARAHESRQPNVLSLVLPVLVVPNQTLWQVTYNDEGTVVSPPKQCDRCQHFLNRRVSGGLTLSHLEIVTFNGLKQLLDGIVKPGYDPNWAWFPGTAK